MNRTMKDDVTCWLQTRCFQSNLSRKYFSSKEKSRDFLHKIVVFERAMKGERSFLDYFRYSSCITKSIFLTNTSVSTTSYRTNLFLSLLYIDVYFIFRRYYNRLRTQSKSTFSRLSSFYYSAWLVSCMLTAKRRDVYGIESSFGNKIT